MGKRKMLVVSERDVIWLTTQVNIGPLTFAFRPGGLALDEEACPEAAARLRAYWAEALI